jgi:uncharacterized protein YceH (UPF0502 family)
MDQDATQQAERPQPQWRPLTSVQRRVLGVLVEKAKTTPDQYPMTLNSLTNGCNQKTNRDPQMELKPDQVEQALDELRQVGAVAEVQGTSRVAKYRHYAYEWLGVDKVESAVMTELLLRGEQTIGELRGRAARMEPIADLAALRPILQSLMQKGLVISLTPEGRGQVVTHALFKDRDLSELRTRYASHAAEADSAGDDEEAPHSPAAPTPRRPPSSGGVTSDMFAELRLEVAELRAEVARLRQQVGDLQTQLS